VEVIRELQDRVDVKPLALELLRHGDADDLPIVDLVHRERWLVRAKHLGDFRVDKEHKICAESALNATKLLGRLTEKAITESDDQLVRTLAALVHQSFDGRIGIRLIEQKPVNVRNCDVRFHMPEDFKPGLNRDLRLGREERILSAATGQRDGSIHDDLGIRRSGNVRVARNVDLPGDAALVFACF
jgi:hypothetical protein